MTIAGKEIHPIHPANAPQMTKAPAACIAAESQKRRPITHQRLQQLTTYKQRRSTSESTAELYFAPMPVHA